MINEMNINGEMSPDQLQGFQIQNGQSNIMSEQNSNSNKNQEFFYQQKKQNDLIPQNSQKNLILNSVFKNQDILDVILHQSKEQSQSQNSKFQDESNQVDEVSRRYRKDKYDDQTNKQSQNNYDQIILQTRGQDLIIIENGIPESHNKISSKEENIVGFEQRQKPNTNYLKQRIQKQSQLHYHAFQTQSRDINSTIRKSSFKQENNIPENHQQWSIKNLQVKPNMQYINHHHNNKLLNQLNQGQKINKRTDIHKSQQNLPPTKSRNLNEYQSEQLILNTYQQSNDAKNQILFNNYDLSREQKKNIFNEEFPKGLQSLKESAAATSQNFTQFNLFKSRNYIPHISQTQTTAAYPMNQISYSNSNAILNQSYQAAKTIEDTQKKDKASKIQNSNQQQNSEIQRSKTDINVFDSYTQSQNQTQYLGKMQEAFNRQKQSVDNKLNRQNLISAIEGHSCQLKKKENKFQQSKGSSFIPKIQNQYKSEIVSSIEQPDIEKLRKNSKRAIKIQSLRKRSQKDKYEFQPQFAKEEYNKISVELQQAFIESEDDQHMHDSQILNFHQSPSYDLIGIYQQDQVKIAPKHNLTMLSHLSNKTQQNFVLNKKVINAAYSQSEDKQTSFQDSYEIYNSGQFLGTSQSSNLFYKNGSQPYILNNLQQNQKVSKKVYKKIEFANLEDMDLSKMPKNKLERSLTKRFMNIQNLKENQNLISQIKLKNEFSKKNSSSVIQNFSTTKTQYSLFNKKFQKSSTPETVNQSFKEDKSQDKLASLDNSKDKDGDGQNIQSSLEKIKIVKNKKSLISQQKERKLKKQVSDFLKQLIFIKEFQKSKLSQNGNQQQDITILDELATQDENTQVNQSKQIEKKRKDFKFSNENPINIIKKQRQQRNNHEKQIYEEKNEISISENSSQIESNNAQISKYSSVRNNLIQNLQENLDKLQMYKQQGNNKSGSNLYNPIQKTNTSLLIGKLKGQLSSTAFYLQKGLVADSQSKYTVFNYLESNQIQNNPKLPAQNTKVQVNDGGMCQTLDIIQGEYPVYCKINVPKNNTEKNQKEANKILQLKFLIRENNYVHSETIVQKSITKNSSEDDFPQPTYKYQKKQKEQKQAQLSSDLTVYVSSVSKEPNENNCNSRYINQTKFVYTCMNQNQDFIYFTLKSQKGCNIKLKLEFLGFQTNVKTKSTILVDPFAPKPIRLNARIKNQGDEILDDIDFLDKMYPTDDGSIRSKQEKQKLFSFMLNELTSYQQDQTYKIIRDKLVLRRRLEAQAQGIHNLDDLNDNDFEDIDFINANYQTQAVCTHDYLIHKLRARSEKIMFRQLIAQERRENQYIQKLKKLKNGLVKWEIYREKRQKAINLFAIKLKQRRKIYELIALIKIHKILGILNSVWKIYKKEQNYKMKAMLICRSFSYKFKNFYCLHWGRDIKKRLRNILRRSFTVVAGQILNCSIGGQDLQAVKNQSSSPSKDSVSLQLQKVSKQSLLPTLISERAKKVLKNFLKDRDHQNFMLDKIKLYAYRYWIKYILTQKLQQNYDIHRVSYIYKRIENQIEFFKTYFENLVEQKIGQPILQILENQKTKQKEETATIYVMLKSLQYRKQRSLNLIDQLSVKLQEKKASQKRTFQNLNLLSDQMNKLNMQIQSSIFQQTNQNNQSGILTSQRGSISATNNQNKDMNQALSEYQKKTKEKQDLQEIQLAQLKLISILDSKIQRLKKIVLIQSEQIENLDKKVFQNINPVEHAKILKYSHMLQIQLFLNCNEYDVYYEHKEIRVQFKEYKIPYQIKKKYFEDHRKALGLDVPVVASKKKGSKKGNDQSKEQQKLNLQKKESEDQTLLASLQVQEQLPVQVDLKILEPVREWVLEQKYKKENWLLSDKGSKKYEKKMKKILEVQQKKPKVRSFEYKNNPEQFMLKPTKEEIQKMIFKIYNIIL